MQLVNCEIVPMKVHPPLSWRVVFASAGFGNTGTEFTVQYGKLVFCNVAFVGIVIVTTVAVGEVGTVATSVNVLADVVIVKYLPSTAEPEHDAVAYSTIWVYLGPNWKV